MDAQYTGYMWILWDLAAVLALVCFVYVGASRGLIRTAVSLLGFVAAAALGNFLSPLLAQALYDGIIRDALRIVIMNRVEELLSSGGTAGRLIDAVPGILRGFLPGGAWDPVTGADALAGALSSDTAGLVETIIDAALREPVLSILSGILFLMLFSLTLLVTRHVARLFTAVYKIPVIGVVNTLAGGIVGVLQALLALFVAALCCQLLIAFSSGGFFWLNDSVLDDTYIFRVFYNMAKF